MKTVAPPSSSAAWTALRFLAILVARGYRAILLTLAAIALVPTLCGFGAFVVSSGSMEPELAVGDVAIAKHLGPSAKVPVGRVMVFRNPARRDGSLLIHRIVAKRDDGKYVSEGDANGFTDSTPVTRDAITRQPVLRAPYIGKPIFWVQTGAWLQLGAWLALTIGAFVVASRKLDLNPEQSQQTDELPEVKAQPGRHRRAAPRRSVLTPRVVCRAFAAAPRRIAIALIVMIAGAVLVVTTQSASATFTARTRDSGNSWAVPNRLLQPYTAAVMADNPELLWHLDEPSGTVAADSSLKGHSATMTGINAYGQPGALPHNLGTAVQLGGSTDRIVENGAAVSPPSDFTLEMWFKTTTPSGKLIGFESGQGANSLMFDRTVTFDALGHLVYGTSSVSGDQVKTIASPKSYTDGKWHHLAVTVTGFTMPTGRIYVDGVQVASGPVTQSIPNVLGTYTGWWRVGYGQTNANPLTYGSLTAQVDAVAEYNSALSATRIAAHYNAA